MAMARTMDLEEVEIERKDSYQWGVTDLAHAVLLQIDRGRSTEELRVCLQGMLDQLAVTRGAVFAEYNFPSDEELDPVKAAPADR